MSRSRSDLEAGLIWCVVLSCVRTKSTCVRIFALLLFWPTDLFYLCAVVPENSPCGKSHPTARRLGFALLSSDDTDGLKAVLALEKSYPGLCLGVCVLSLQESAGTGEDKHKHHQDLHKHKTHRDTSWI